GVVPGGDLAVDVEGAVGAGQELVLVERERRGVLARVVPRQLGVEVAQAQDVVGEVLRVGVLLDQEAQRALGGGRTIVEDAAVLPPAGGGGGLPGPLLPPGEGPAGRAGVPRAGLAPRVR